MVLHIDILIILSILNLGSSCLISLLEQIYVFAFISIGLILIVLWYVLLSLSTKPNNLSIKKCFNKHFKGITHAH